ncbi:MAG: hypothetical protein R6V18_01930 [Desulfuromonadaceae bacterium]
MSIQSLRKEYTKIIFLIYVILFLPILCSADVIDPEEYIRKNGYHSVKMGDDQKAKFYSYTERLPQAKIESLEADIEKLPKHADVMQMCDFMRGSVKALLLEEQGISCDVAVTNYGYQGSTISCVLKYMYEGNIGTQLIYSKKGADGMYMVFVSDNTEKSHSAEEDLTSVAHLQFVAEQYNAETPKKLDSYTIFLGIIAKPDELVYRYKIINIKTDKKSLEKFMSMQTPVVINHMCSTPETKWLINNGVTLTSAYYDENNQFFGRVKVTNSSCN